MGSETVFKGITNIGDCTPSEQIATNMVSFFDWSFLETGAFWNVQLDQPGPYGGNKSKLLLIKDPNYTLGQVWEGSRGNWVWESGISQSTQPIQISGIYIDNTFYPVSTTGAYSYKINYPLGRIVFNSAISTSSTIKVEHSYKWIKIGTSDDYPLFKQIQYESLKPNNVDNTLVGSGDYAVLADTRIQLPAIIVEVAPIGNKIPYGLGGGQYVQNKVLCHVLGEDDYTVRKIADILSQQEGKTIFMFDVDRLGTEGRFPLDINGSIASGALTYPDLVTLQEYGGFRYNQLRFEETEGQPINSLAGSYHGVVRITTSVLVPKI